ncbi:glycoside hydrolase family 3 protein [Aeromicrobium sp. CF3.5]|uniref:glycoside hydrolase family 3 protein n=1 Tax=Aeromicrobium sp. CF3.5 TaxID=3373078 RepID=UPI003EE76245
MGSHTQHSSRAQKPGRGRLILAASAVAVLAVGGASAVVATSGSSTEPAAAPATSSASAPEAPAAWGPTDAEIDAAEKSAADLTLEELAGQLIVARHFDDESSLALVRDQHFAGVMVTGDRILDIASEDPLSSVTSFNDELEALGEQRDVPVMVPIDQEGGLVARLKEPLTPFPTAMSSGAAITGDPEAGAAAVTAATRASGAELRAAGFNVVFAPGGDTTIGPDDPIIGTRSPGSDPEVVAQSVTAAVDGYSEAGIISAVKHFPGHNVDVDSHEGLPVLESDRARLSEHDLVPFEAAIADSAPGIMTGHIDVPAIDPGVPASMSRPAITGELRDRMGYDGLIVSDSLGMGAVMNSYPGGEAAVQAIKAGSDIALMPADNLEAYDAMLKALKSGDLPEEQARASAARTIAWLSHVEASPVPEDGEPGSHVEEAEALSAAAVTMVAEPCEPVDAPTSFVPYGSPDVVAAFTRAAEDAGVGIGSGPSVILLGYGSSGATGDIVVSTDRPFALNTSQAATKIALFGEGEPAMRALVDVLTGKAEPGGEMPVEGVDVSTC